MAWNESPLFVDETVIPDDHMIYGDYYYLADGRVYRSVWHSITVGELRRREGFSEVRRCNWRRFNGTNRQIADLKRGFDPGCGCCVGPVEDRCVCHFHQDVTRGQSARKCSLHGGGSR